MSLLPAAYKKTPSLLLKQERFTQDDKDFNWKLVRWSNWIPSILSESIIEIVILLLKETSANVYFGIDRFVGILTLKRIFLPN